MDPTDMCHKGQTPHSFQEGSIGPRARPLLPDPKAVVRAGPRQPRVCGKRTGAPTDSSTGLLAATPPSSTCSPASKHFSTGPEESLTHGL